MAKKVAKKKSAKKPVKRTTAKRKPAMRAKPAKKAPPKKAAAKKPSPKAIKAPPLTFERIAARPVARIARAQVRIPIAAPVGRTSLLAAPSQPKMFPPHDREE